METFSTRTVYIHKDDVKRLEDWVLQYPDTETGGNLFGLFTHNGNIVVHVVVGPGRNCRRTSVSFNQDVNYMERVGEFVTSKYMLCHVGEWHSHHQMSLSVPSSGDEHTIWSNLPASFPSFLLIIANINSTGEAHLNPYIFINKSRPYVHAQLKILPKSNPYMERTELKDAIRKGEAPKGSKPYFRYRPAEITCNDSTVSSNRIQYNRSDYRNIEQHTSQVMVSSDVTRSSTSTRYDVEKKGIEAGVQTRCASPSMQYNTTQTTYQSSYNVHLATGSSESRDRGAGSQYSVTSRYTPNSAIEQSSKASSKPRQVREADVKVDQWYSTSDGQKCLKAITERVQSSLSGRQEVKISRDEGSHDISLTFTHNNRQVNMDFPADFPASCIKIQMQDRTEGQKLYLPRDVSLCYPNTIAGEVVDSFKKLCICSNCLNDTWLSSSSSSRRQIR